MYVQNFNQELLLKLEGKDDYACRWYGKYFDPIDKLF